MIIGSSSNRTFHAICGSLSIAYSLMFNVRFGTLLKCSVHLSKIASLSVRRVRPSAPSNVVAPDLFGFSSPFCPQKTEFLYVFKLGLDCLINVAVGCFLGY